MIAAGTPETGANCNNVRREARDAKTSGAPAKMRGRYIGAYSGRGNATWGDRPHSQARGPETRGRSRAPDRRGHLARRVLVLSTIGWWGLANGAAAQVIELRVSHFMPPNHTFQKELLRWADELDKASSGRLKLRIYPASQLGPVQRQFDLVKSGVADIAVGLHGATPGRYPLTEVVSLPFVSPKNATNSAVTSRRLTELGPAYLADEHQGLRVLWMAVTNPLMFHLAKVPIKTIQDFRGLRIRYAGQQVAKIIGALAGVPLAVPPGEATDALAKGIVDGATFPYEAAQSFDLGSVIRYTLEPGVSTATFAVVMNPKKFQELPDDLKALIISTTGPEAAAHFGKEWDEAEKRGKEYMIAKGVKVLVLPDEELQSMRSLLAPIVTQAIDDLDARGKPARQFFEAYTE
jgi:TRAP-type transport system periplasmic protein